MPAFPYPFGRGVFLPEEVAMLRHTFERVAADSTVPPEDAEREWLGRYIMRMYQQGMVIPAKLEQVGMLAAQKRFGAVNVQARPRALTGRRVLVVEDEYFIARELSDQLRRDGGEVVGPVGTVDAALKMVDAPEIQIDAALLDINVHEQMVFPVAAVLRRKGVPFIFVTGFEKVAIPPEFQDRKVFGKPAESGSIAGELAKSVRYEQVSQDRTA